MSDQEGQGVGIEALKQKITKLEARIKDLEAENKQLKEENSKLKQSLEKGADLLEQEIEEQRKAAIDTITEKTSFSKDELEGLKLPGLRLILKTLDNTKGTVKGVGKAGSDSQGKSSLTVGNLYHKE